ncbi:MAG: YegP family protein [Clostridia bacterium]|nr:YegP family protein [Clostridia bacterium]
MGFWAKLFGKKKQGLGEDDGQAKYFKEDFNPREKKQVKKAVKADTKVETENEKTLPDKKEKEPVNITQNSKSTKSKNEKATPELQEDSPEVKGAVSVKESKPTTNGKFDIRNAKDGRYFFSLYASNGAVIAYSQIYSSLSSVTTGINSVIANADKAGIEDTTLKKPQSLTCPKWEIYIDRAGQYRFRLYASNGLCVCHSTHGYTTKSGCKGGIDSIRRFAGEARVDKSYLK